MPKRRKRCRFCGELFTPNPRLKGKQYACRKPECQRQRHRANCREWNHAHRDHFRGRFPQTRAWLDRHPGYFAEYRRGHPAAADRHRDAERERLRRRRGTVLDIQDSIWLQTHMEQRVGSSYGPLDIQDSFSSYLFFIIGLSASYRALDKQDSIAPPLPRLYSSGKEIWQWARRERERQGC